MTPTCARMAAIQMTSGADLAGNLAEAARWIETAARSGAGLIVLPENFALMPRHERERADIAEVDGRGPIQDFLAAQARAHGVWLVGGTVPLRATPPRLRSACMLFDARGERVARYDKIHLFDVALAHGETYNESRQFEGGNLPVVVDTPVGRLGLAVCYDLRFPELFRRMLEQGAELFALPSAFTVPTGQAHWEVLVRARAIENLAYVIAADQGGEHANGRRTYGDSMVVNPWGEVLARRAQGAGVVIADFDRERLAQVRTRLPSINHRRM